MMPQTNNEIEVVATEEVLTEIVPELDGIVVDFEADYDNVRDNLTDALRIGREALQSIAEFANTAPSAKVFETLSKVLSAYSDTNIKLMQVHETRKRLRGKISNPKNTLNQNLIITTSALLKMFKEASKKENG